MIPKYPFMVEVTSSLGQQQTRVTKNYETWDGAHAYSSIVMRKRTTKRVRVLVIIDETEVHHAE